MEQGNLKRQAFCCADVGQNKALCMAGVLNDAFALRWRGIPRYLLKEKELADLEEKDAIPLIIGCVDNVGCRLVCEKYFMGRKNCIYIDSANEFSSGEVVYAARGMGKDISPVRSVYFPEILAGDVRGIDEMSCEELNESFPQHICTNMLAGNLLLSAVSGLLENGAVPTGITMFDSASQFMEHHEGRKEGCHGRAYEEAG